MGLELHIPQQTKANKDGFPVAPRKVKRWLNQLSEANLRETTRLFFRGIEQLNNLEISAKDRLSIMELLRPAARLILDNLEKRFLALGLPLPEKTRRIYDLNIALLQHMAIGYKIALVDTDRGKSRLGGKLIAMTAQRASSYLTEIMLRAAQVYSPLPKGLWEDLNRICAFAEHHRVGDRTIRDSELRSGKKLSPRQAYLRAALFTLAHPESLRRGDAEKVYTVLEDWARECEFSQHFLDAALPGVFVVDLTIGTPPGHPSATNAITAEKTWFLDLRVALGKVHTLQARQPEMESPLATANLSPSALRRLETNWGMSSERTSKRAKKARHAIVEVGLKNIYNRIISELEPADQVANKKPEFNAELSLQAIPANERRGIENNGYLIHPDHKNYDEGPDVWDMVGAGNTLTIAYREEIDRKRREGAPLIDTTGTQDWKLIDVSAGGYGLRWDGESPSKAHVGEVVGLRELQRGTYAQWRIGVIRWMQFINDTSFEVGIQALSPHGMAVSVERQQRGPGLVHQECLVLPEIKPIAQSTSLLAPAHMYKTGEVIRVHIFDKEMLVKLTGVVEHTGSFTQFTIESADTATNTKNHHYASSEPGLFDSGVWSSI